MERGRAHAVAGLSALPPKADQQQASPFVRFVANSDRMQCSEKSLLDHFVGEGERRRRLVEIIGYRTAIRMR
jgi:hypothetical protein